MRNCTRIYFDNAAATPLRPEVRAAMEPYWSDTFGNAGSPYAVSRAARMAIDRARTQVAALIGAHSDEIVFTSGGTESDNWALLGVALANLETRCHAIVSAIEHHAVLETATTLRELGFEVEEVGVDGNGVVQLETLDALLRPETCLVSIMTVNNETGVVQPLEAISQRTRERGIVLHSDAVQAAGKVLLDVEGSGIDIASLSAHKLGGPKGVGALWVRRGTRMRALLRGGGQERGRRAGTENVPGIVGFGAACELAELEMEANREQMCTLRERLEQGVREIEGARLNGESAPRAPHITNFSLPGNRGESMALNFDMRGFAIGTGSACASGALEPSHVLAAMGLSRAEARSSLRVSLSAQNTGAEVDEFLDVLRELVKK
ncbi:MAG: cysteine desulfurase [Abditibacteriota bacterium]|nr:cysteine desulfurase [Abditibacteriota bacterium]